MSYFSNIGSPLHEGFENKENKKCKIKINMADGQSFNITNTDKFCDNLKQENKSNIIKNSGNDSENDNDNDNDNDNENRK